MRTQKTLVVIAALFALASLAEARELRVKYRVTSRVEFDGTGNTYTDVAMEIEAPWVHGVVWPANGGRLEFLPPDLFWKDQMNSEVFVPNVQNLQVGDQILLVMPYSFQTDVLATITNTDSGFVKTDFAYDAPLPIPDSIFVQIHKALYPDRVPTLLDSITITVESASSANDGLGDVQHADIIDVSYPNILAATIHLAAPQGLEPLPPLSFASGKSRVIVAHERCDIRNNDRVLLFRRDGQVARIFGMVQHDSEGFTLVRPPSRLATLTLPIGDQNVLQTQEVVFSPYRSPDLDGLELQVGSAMSVGFHGKEGKRYTSLHLSRGGIVGAVMNTKNPDELTFLHGMRFGKTESVIDVDETRYIMDDGCSILLYRRERTRVTLLGCVKKNGDDYLLAPAHPLAPREQRSVFASR